jgi:hypothetical protein
MQMQFLRHKKVNSVDELQQKLNETIDALNREREAPCWVCRKVVMNWGVCFPDAPGGLGLGHREDDGKPSTRLAFFPFCPEHDLESEEVIEAVQRKLESLRQQLSN